MLRLRNAIAVGFSALLLGACQHYGAEATGITHGFDLQEAVKTSAPSDPFWNAAYHGYIELAEIEFAEGDYEDSDRFARRAMAISDGKVVEPENPITHRWIPAEYRGEMIAEIWRLQRALRAGAREWAPEPAARAQVMYDCWVEEQEENFEPEEIARCRDGFLAAMAEVEALWPRVIVEPPPPPPGPYVVFFDFDSSELTNEARATLDEVIADAAVYEPTVVIVRGHTDLAGSAQYNMGLSKRRAETVAAYLAGRGIDTSIIAVDWFGETRPLVATPDGVPEQANRRAEIELEK